MAASTNTDAKALLNWIDGQPSANVQKPTTIDGNLTYWLDGEPYAYVYPNETTTAATFMPFFWGI